MADVEIIVGDELWTIDEGILTDALLKQIPMDPNTSTGQWSVDHCCPVCGNRLKAPGVLQFKNGSYCDQCGQKIKWGDCSD